jgi:hypothetical protein
MIVVTTGRPECLCCLVMKHYWKLYRSDGHVVILVIIICSTLGKDVHKTAVRKSEGKRSLWDLPLSRRIMQGERHIPVHVSEIWSRSEWVYVTPGRECSCDGGWDFMSEVTYPTWSVFVWDLPSTQCSILLAEAHRDISHTLYYNES